MWKSAEYARMNRPHAFDAYMDTSRNCKVYFLKIKTDHHHEYARWGNALLSKQRCCWTAIQREWAISGDSHSLKIFWMNTQFDVEADWVWVWFGWRYYANNDDWWSIVHVACCLLFVNLIKVKPKLFSMFLQSSEQNLLCKLF